MTTNHQDMQSELTAALQWRYATKKFDSQKKISAEDWKILEESLHLAPSSYGLQPWKFLVVQKEELRVQLTAASWKQAQVESCSHYVVLATLKTLTEEYIDHFVESVASQRDVPLESLAGYRKVMVGDLVKGARSQVIGHWAQKQAYIAMGIVMHSAALLKIDSCPMEGIDPQAYDKILGLTSTPYTSAAAVALGYRHPEDKYQSVKKVRFPVSDVIQYL